MASLKKVKGVVVAVGRQVNPRLRRVARAHRLVILEAPSVRIACQAILGLHPRVIVVQVSPPAIGTLELIRSARRAGTSRALIAVAAVHANEVELATRAAGATWYLPDDTSRLFDEVLAAGVSEEN